MVTKAFALLALVLAPLAGAQTAYRLLQADYQGRQIGSKHYSADGYVTLPRGSAKPYKAVMVLPVNSTSPEALADYTQQKSSLSCVLLVLPSSWDSSGMPAADASNLLRLEQQLLAAPAQVPVFFAKETAALADAVAETHAMFERGAPPTLQTDRYQLALQGKMPTQLASKQATNYVATLRAADDHLKLGVPPPPTLLLTAHFDSFSLAPGSPAGADAAATGAAACLLLLRLLHRLVLDAAQVAADAISRWLYPQLEPQLCLLDLSSEPQQHRDFLAGWIELLSTAPSMMPFDKADPGISLLHENIFQFMRTHSHSAKRHMWTPAGTPASITAFGCTTATMRVLKAAGFMQDMLLLAAVLLYLGGLWVVLVVATRGWAELRAMWAPKPATRRRNTKGGSSSNSSKRS
ncbi:hypothetical protein OEZ85_007776 [Tetradesmus obliquus]|uniref:Peptidase M28 domain-containing protein n=1 Tax=Tetradesmus obliquus TaxID=3088 RepID=A0ABY8TH63_TETOB|nr:hypothetical protein OEZ85_007776 [Tetradesmus obliquus]